jgi:hypothetical protein
MARICAERREMLGFEDADRMCLQQSSHKRHTWSVCIALYFTMC